MRTLELPCPSSPIAVPEVEETASPCVNGFRDPYARAYAGHATELARSALALVRRSDAHGSYRHEAGEVRGTTPKEPLTETRLVQHFRGDGAPVGAHLLDAQDLVEWMVFDLDRHPRDDGSFDRTREDVLHDALTIHYGLVARGLFPILEQSCPNGSCKVWLFLDKPIPAAVARVFARWFTTGFDPRPEIFPKQDTAWVIDRDTGVRRLAFGNWVRQPGRHHTYRDFWSRFWDPEVSDWADPEATIAVWLNRRDSSSATITELAQRNPVEQPSPRPPQEVPSPPSSADRETTDPETLRHRIDPYLATIREATQGQKSGTGRADVLFRAAAKLAVDWALPDECTLESLRSVNDGFGTQYPESKLGETLSNAHRYGKGAYGNDLAPPTSADPPASRGQESEAAAGNTRVEVPPFICVTDLLAKVLPKVPSVLGGDRYPNLWRQGTNAELHGPEGKGKTMAATWLAVCLAAMQDWFGIPGPWRPLRVAMVATELDEELVQTRLGLALDFLGKTEEDTAEVASRLFVLPSDVWMPSGSTSLSIDRFQAEMDGLCERLAEIRADVGIFDPLLTFWSEKMNYAPLVDYALRMPRELPGFSPMWIQHNRKEGIESGSADALANSIGDGDWTRRGLRTAFQLAPYGKSKAVRELIVTKSNHSQAPPPIYLRHSTEYGGLLEVCPKPDTPTEVAEDNRERFLGQVLARPGITVKELSHELGVTERQARDGLQRLADDGRVHKRPQPAKKNRGQIPDGYWPGAGRGEP